MRVTYDTRSGPVRSGPAPPAMRELGIGDEPERETNSHSEWTRSRGSVIGVNNCGLGDMSQAKIEFDGTTSAVPNAGAWGCSPKGATDGVSVVAWANLYSEELEGSPLAAACRWGHPAGSHQEIDEADIVVSTYHTWTTAPNPLCPTLEYDLESTLAHEWGHVFGIDHVETQLRSQTMSPVQFACRKAHRTLGYGDMLGLASVTSYGG